MTQELQHLDTAQDNGTSEPRNLVGTTSTGTSIQLSSTHIIVDSASDNDTSERPVREKLKKTSLASLPRDNLMSPRAHTESERDDAMLTHHDMARDEQTTGVRPGPRGRPLRKRSFDDIEPAECNTFEVTADVISNTGGHARKRSRDVRVGAGFDGENRKRGAPETPVQEVDERNLSDNEMAELEDNRFPESGALSHIQGAVDEDMTDSTLLPRKKRSRDQFDTAMDREQKIPATEEAKAQRRSEESERHAIEKDLNNEGSTAERGDQVDQEIHNTHVKYDEESEKLNADKDDPSWAEIPKKDDNNALSKQKLEGSFGNSSTVSPFASFANQKASNPPTSPKPVKDDISHTSNTAFAASGFAALSSTTSPFGALGSLTKTNISSSFSSLIPRAKSTDPETGESSTVGTSQVPNGGLSAPSTTLSFGMTALSAFGSAGISPPTQFGTTFGSGYGSAFGTGPRLNSFAAPKGDAVLGSGSGTISSFGQPDKDDDDDSRSDSEDEALSDTTRDQEGAETNEKSHHQGIDTGEDDEETIFSSPRVNLYAWDGTRWKERGGGIFKLNVPKPNPDDPQSHPKTARFIMRAHQTYRVLLNTPIFKQMKIGDKDGNAPRGKVIAFTGIEGGKPIPYQIKLNDNNESKILHGDVKKLQETL